MTTSQVKLSAILNATSLTRSIRRQKRQHSPVLQVRCYAIAGDQHESIATEFEEICKEVPQKLGAFYRFCRPHTIFGTVSFIQFCMAVSDACCLATAYCSWIVCQIIGITSVSLLPMRSLDDFTMKALWGFLEVSYINFVMNAVLKKCFKLNSWWTLCSTDA